MLYLGHEVGRRAPAGPLLEIDLRERLPGVIPHDEAGAGRSFENEQRVARAFWNLTSLGRITSSELGGVLMPLTGAIPEGRSFFCPHCGALYAVTYSRLSTSDSNIARCVVCAQIMDKWDSAKAPIFKLIHRPEDY
jgi:hypothetical protein